MAAVIADTARFFGRAIIMPNLSPPVRTAREAESYRGRIHAALPSDESFTPLMTCYLTDNTDAVDLVAGYRDQIFTAAKLYPAGATTNSDAGVTNVDLLDPVLAAMAENGVPLLIHGEVVDAEVDVFDREALFIESILEPLRQRHPTLKVVLEHITTADAVDYVSAGDPALLAATITPHHLRLNRNAMFNGGIRPHHYCLPIIKRERHRAALVRAACSGDSRYFLGTDSAPHTQHAKESACGCAGIFNAPTAMTTYLEIFRAANALDKFEAFASINGPRFYGLDINQQRVVYERVQATEPPGARQTADGDVTIFDPDYDASWQLVRHP